MKPLSTLLSAAVLATALGSALPVLAAEGGGAKNMFDQLDNNKDGAISRDEASRSAQVTTDFGQMDTKGDGQISREEWQAYFSGTRSAGAPESNPALNPPVPLTVPDPTPTTPSTTNRPAVGSSAPPGAK